MKWNPFVAVFVLLATPPVAQAESNFAGIGYGQISVNDRDSGFEVETDNLGIVIGGVENSGLGFELFYNFSAREDEISVNDVEVAQARITSYGVLAVYQSPGTVYVKGKAGFAVVDLDFDLSAAAGSFDDDTSGIAYGAAVGVRLGAGAVELSYLVMPEFNDFEGLDFDAEVDLITLGYNWNF